MFPFRIPAWAPILLPAIAAGHHRRIFPYDIDGPFKQTLMTLFRLAWSYKIQLPLLITVAFMAFDIHLQMEINIVWEANRNNNRREEQNEHDRDVVRQQEQFRRQLLLQINGAQAPLAQEEDDEDEYDTETEEEEDGLVRFDVQSTSPSLYSKAESSDDEESSSGASLPSDIDSALPRYKYWKKDGEDDDEEEPGRVPTSQQGQGAQSSQQVSETQNQRSDGNSGQGGQGTTNSTSNSSSSQRCECGGEGSSSTENCRKVESVFFVGGGELPSWNTLKHFLDLQKGKGQSALPRKLSLLTEEEPWSKTIDLRPRFSPLAVVGWPNS